LFFNKNCTKTAKQKNILPNTMQKWRDLQLFLTKKLSKTVIFAQLMPKMAF